MAPRQENGPRDDAARRRVVAGSTLGVGVLLLAVLLAMANYFGWKYHQRFDWTSSRIYTLSPKSQQVLAGLTKDVTAIVFLRPGSNLYDPVKELLARYEAASPHLKVRFVDPDRNPVEAQQLVSKYQVQSLDLVVFDSGADKRLVQETDLADWDYSGMQMGEPPQMTGFKGEQRFTGALLELQEKERPKIVFTTGHGEHALDDGSDKGLTSAQELLTRDNFAVEEWASLGKPAVPEGTGLVVVAGPTSSFVQPEIDALERFLAGGGRVLVMLDPTLATGGGSLQQTGLEPWLAAHGVEVGQDIVVDPSNPLPFFGPETIFVNGFGDHAITRARQQAAVPVILPLARSVRAGKAPAGETAVELLHTSADGWAETNLADLNKVEKDARDLPGPVSLGVVVEPEGEAKPPMGEDDMPPPPPPTPAKGPQSRLVVLGDSDFATNGQVQNVGNPTLLANTVNWLVQRENLLGIPPKAPEQVRLSLTGGQLASIYWLVLAILPGLAITAGIVVSLRRRR